MNRFLKFLLAAAGMLMLTAACGKSDGPEEPGKGGGNGGTSRVPKGKVTCNGQGIAGVVVTDGTYFALTDDDGSYSLPLNPKAVHIYISSPAGYSVPVENGVAMFWTRLDAIEDKGAIDFRLTATGDDTRHRFVAVGDPQIRNNNTEKRLQDDKLTQLAADIRALGETLPVHVMVAGDVAFNNMTVYPDSRASFAKLGQPVYYAIGNHDHKPTGNTDVSYSYDKTADADFISHYGPTCYSFNRGKVHYVVFDNIYFKGGSDGAKYDIYVTPEQLKWIEKDLSYVSKEHAVVLMAHSPTQTRRAPNPSSYGNSDRVHALVSDFKAVQIVTGHTHYNTVVDANNTIEHVVGALCGGFWEGPVCLDGTVLGYKIFEVDGTDFKWEYTPAEPEYKEKTFTWFTRATSTKPLSNVSLCINVWDWDTKWKVEYSTDNGASWKGMTRSDFASSGSYDPTAHTLFGTSSDDGLPSAARQWINAGTTDHLFTCTVASDQQQVKVRTTDRFGKTCTQDIPLAN